MSISSVSSPNALTQLYEGLSSDTKPTVGVQAFALFKETDTGNVYEYSGAAWHQTSVAGAIKLSGDTQPPESWFLAFEDEAADVNDNTVVYESPSDVSMYNHHEFSIYQAPGAGAVEVLISHDGVTYEATPVYVYTDQYAQGGLANQLNSLVAIGNYHFDRKVKMWKLQNNGATTGAVTKVRGSHSVV